MMSLNELYDQIDADEKAIDDSVVADEKGFATQPMAPLEVLVRHTVFSTVAGWIEDDFEERTVWQPESDAERERLEAAGLCASYDEYDVADFAARVLDDLRMHLCNWAFTSDFSDESLACRCLGETREQVKTLAKKFLEELISWKS